ncbi:MAG: diacylglycerol/lipid kinase family protein [Promethearchaeota archaeon]
MTDKGIQRYFLGIGSQGFDAEVTKRTNESVKGLMGTRNYVLNVIKTIFRWRNKKIRVIMDEDEYIGPANLIAVGNGPSYGGGMYICQNARINDGKFHISVVNKKKFRLLRDFNKMYSASAIPHPGISEYVSTKIRIEMKHGEEKPYLCQVDGEILENIPVEYQVIKNGHELICPKTDEVATVFKKKYGRYYYE